MFVTVKVYHCANSDRPFDNDSGFGTHSVRQCKRTYIRTTKSARHLLLTSNISYVWCNDVWACLCMKLMWRMNPPLCELQNKTWYNACVMIRRYQILTETFIFVSIVTSMTILVSITTLMTLLSITNDPQIREHTLLIYGDISSCITPWDYDY